MTCIRVGVALLVASAMPAWGAELELRYAAIERVIANQLFSQNGRLYVRGSKTTPCKFAYLESPHVGAVDGRLRVSARFSGRTARYDGCLRGARRLLRFHDDRIACGEKWRTGFEGSTGFYATGLVLHPPRPPGAHQ